MDVQMPLWGWFLTAIAGPAMVYVGDKWIKPWWERRQSKEDAHDAMVRDEAVKLNDIVNELVKERQALLLGQIAELKLALKEAVQKYEQELEERDQRIEEVVTLHQQCKDDTANQAVLLAKVTAKQELLEERLRAQQERTNGLSAENAELRRMVVQGEKRA